jgi:DNA-binding transcriptional MerR regulator
MAAERKTTDETGKERHRMTIKEVSEQYDISQDTLRYYERVGMIPAVTRTAGGIRDYQAEDLRWVELARCMRSAGLSVEALIEYVRLTQAGDETIPARLQLLREQKEQLEIQRGKIDAALARLDGKIERYQIAVDTGVLSWPGKQ